MADIRIEKKERSSILPWILGLLVAALAIWGIAEAFDEGEEMLVDEEIEEPVNDYGSEIVERGNTYSLVDFEDEEIGRDYYNYAADYETYTANMTGEMGLDHEFSHNALTKLANTTAALATAHGMGADVNIQAEKRKIMSAANYITRDPNSTDHADRIREAAMSIVGVLERVQTAKYPGYEDAVAEVKAAAMDINKSTLTLNQKEDVRDFFGKARVAVMGMRDYDMENRGEEFDEMMNDEDGFLNGDRTDLDDIDGPNTDPDNYDPED